MPVSRKTTQEDAGHHHGTAENSRLGSKRCALSTTNSMCIRSNSSRAPAHDGRIRELPGFGVKTEQTILEAISAHVPGRSASNWPWPFNTQNRCANICKQFQASSTWYSPELPPLQGDRGDIDILVTASDAVKVMDRLVAYDEVKDVAGKGSTRATVILRSGCRWTYAWWMRSASALRCSTSPAPRRTTSRSVDSPGKANSRSANMGVRW